MIPLDVHVRYSPTPILWRKSWAIKVSFTIVRFMISLIINAAIVAWVCLVLLTQFRSFGLFEPVSASRLLVLFIVALNHLELLCETESLVRLIIKIICSNYSSRRWLKTGRSQPEMIVGRLLVCWRFSYGLWAIWVAQEFVTLDDTQRYFRGLLLFRL